MKKILVALLLAVIVGCSATKPAPVSPNAPPVLAPASISEKDNGKTFLVEHGTTLVFSLTKNSSEEYFWAFSNLDGDFEILSDVTRGTTQILKMRASGTGKIELQYCQFGAKGAKILNTLKFGVKLK